MEPDCQQQEADQRRTALASHQSLLIIVQVLTVAVLVAHLSAQAVSARICFLAESLRTRDGLAYPPRVTFPSPKVLDNGALERPVPREIL